MEITSSQTGDQFSENRVINASDRRHPTKANLEYLLFTQIDRAKLSVQYEVAHVAMEAFFATGRPRPEENESY